MRDYQRAFLEFAIDTHVLRFGEFMLKSGRTSPYFFDAGLFNTGRSLTRLGEFYADRLLDWGQSFDTLFGPAYKGIPLVAATAIALAKKTGCDIPYCFNRKEVKDHGEGVLRVGAELKGRVLIIDDVITAGISVAESINIIRKAGAEPTGVCIALDRMERGSNDEDSAIRMIEQHYRIPVLSIVDLEVLVDFLHNNVEHSKVLTAIENYQARYGVSSSQ